MFIANAYAQAAQGGFSMDNLSSFLPIILLFVVLYFLMIRPQQKRQKEQRDLIASLSPGDEVMTSGGVLGKITRVDEQYAILEVNSSTSIMIQKGAVVTLLPRGTMSSLQPPFSQQASLDLE